MPPVRRDRARRPRLTDRAEDVAGWVLISAGLLLIVGAWMSGFAVHTRLAELAVAEGAARTEVTAVLVAAVPGPAGGPASTGVPELAAARWVGADGAPRTGRVPVMSAATAGSTVSVWVERDGRVTTPPSTAADAWVGAILVGFNVQLLGTAVLFGMWVEVRRLTAKVNAARWEREWAQVGPEWSGSTGSR